MHDGRWKESYGCLTTESVGMFLQSYNFFFFFLSFLGQRELTSVHTTGTRCQFLVLRPGWWCLGWSLGRSTSSVCWHKTNWAQAPSAKLWQSTLQVGASLELLSFRRCWTSEFFVFRFFFIAHPVLLCYLGCTALLELWGCSQWHSNPDTMCLKTSRSVFKQNQNEKYDK